MIIWRDAEKHLEKNITKVHLRKLGITGSSSFDKGNLQKANGSHITW